MELTDSGTTEGAIRTYLHTTMRTFGLSVTAPMNDPPDALRLVV